MVTEEIGLNHVFGSGRHGKWWKPTLANTWLQIVGDKPSHIVVPAIHKDRHRIRKELHEVLGYEGTEQPEEMNAFRT
ncbi:iron-sulfur electron transport protein [Actinobacillus pleuropneumoniae]|nr:iron-sulfur electron transport protein [Actinobacillus pleuropneumoniae]